MTKHGTIVKSRFTADLLDLRFTLSDCPFCELENPEIKALNFSKIIFEIENKFEIQLL